MKKWLPLFLLLLTGLTLCGCTTRYYTEDAVPPAVQTLEPKQVVYIVTPRDGRYGEQTYSNSGVHTAEILQNLISPHASSLFVSPVPEDAETALASAGQKGARYVFVPTITNWVHRRAAWSGRASGVSLTVAVYDLAREGNDKRIMQKNLRVKGRNASFASQYPAEILRPLLSRFVGEVF